MADENDTSTGEGMSDVSEVMRDMLGRHREASDAMAEAVAIRRDALEMAEGIVDHAERAATALEQAARQAAEDTVAKAQEQADALVAAAHVRIADAHSQADATIAELAAHISALREALQRSLGAVGDVEGALTQIRDSRKPRVDALGGPYPETPDVPAAAAGPTPSHDGDEPAEEGVSGSTEPGSTDPAEEADAAHEPNEPGEVGATDETAADGDEAPEPTDEPDDDADPQEAGPGAPTAAADTDSPEEEAGADTAAAEGDDDAPETEAPAETAEADSGNETVEEAGDEAGEAGDEAGEAGDEAGGLPDIPPSPVWTSREATGTRLRRKRR